MVTKYERILKICPHFYLKWKPTVFLGAENERFLAIKGSLIKVYFNK